MTTKAITVYVDEDFYEQVRAAAEDDHRSISNFVIYRLKLAEKSYKRRLARATRIARERGNGG